MSNRFFRFGLGASIRRRNDRDFREFRIRSGVCWWRRVCGEHWKEKNSAMGEKVGIGDAHFSASSCVLWLRVALVKGVCGSQGLHTLPGKNGTDTGSMFKDCLWTEIPSSSSLIFESYGTVTIRSQHGVVEKLTRPRDSRTVRSLFRSPTSTAI